MAKILGMNTDYIPNTAELIQTQIEETKSNAIAYRKYNEIIRQHKEVGTNKIEIMEHRERRRSSVTPFTIYGERCSGTNYLEQLILTNFRTRVVWKYGWKHFFGFHQFTGRTDESNTLFLGIVRNELDWLNSLFREQWHFPRKFKNNVSAYLFDTWYSAHDDGRVMEKDLNYKTKQKYKNVFDMRAAKIDFLQNVMPTKTNKYMLIGYEDLCVNYEKILKELQERFNLVPKYDTFRNVTYYKADKKQTYKPKTNAFTYADITAYAKIKNITFTPSDSTTFSSSTTQ